NGWAGLGGRLNNVVAYATPNFSGFSALVAYTTSPLATVESTAVTAAATNGGRKDKGILINPQYKNGPIAVSYSYLNAKNNSLTAAQVAANPTLGVLAGTATNNIDVRSNRLGGAYTFPMGLKVGLMWDKSKVSYNASSVVGNAGLYVERTAWALPITYTTGAHSLYFTYAKASDLKTNIAGGLPNTNAKQYTLAYSYALSKRTDLNVTWSSVSNDTAGQYDFWHPSSNVSGGGGLAAAQAGADPRMFAVGVRHAF
ncbi:MAG: porin, partial [Rhodocyclaceae bacterium]|nr:porin [Rhodocyclaceae bacterium]